MLLRSRLTPVGIDVDPTTGLPAALVSDTIKVPLRSGVTLRTGGWEERSPFGGLRYPDARELTTARLVDPDVLRRVDAGTETLFVHTAVDGWDMWWEYRFRPEHPRLSLGLLLRAPDADAARVLRGLEVELAFALPGSGSWTLNAPGNGLRPDVPLSALTSPVGLASSTSMSGASGLVVATDASPVSLVCWPFSRTEIGRLQVSAAEGELRVDVRTGLAGAPAKGAELEYQGIGLDLLGADWPTLRAEIPRWYDTLGLHTPRSKPDWVASASIFEAQIGWSVFAGDWRYEPYPDAAALLADLGRIAGLGFDTIQVMPRQPYPSYNVHDYDDIDTSYGDEGVLQELVERAHERDMRVILDVLLHGVLDRESIGEAADAVRAGPHGFLADHRAETRNVPGNQAWSRHILDFEQHWKDGSPQRHRLADEHPDWFCRDSAGNITGIYTKAFDHTNTEWQDYVIAAMVRLVERLGIDGFRFDAPTYNTMANWAPRVRERASASPLGCLRLFRRMRPVLKALSPDLLLYTEPSSVVLRESMDLNYNYDEHRPIAAVTEPVDPVPGWGLRHARDLAGWLRDRDAVLPAGSMTAHHIDSHDTFWWQLPGRKWRRERLGLDLTRALQAVFQLSGGAYMMFVGGETGLEDDLRVLHRLRRTRPELASGTCDYAAVELETDDVFAVVRATADSSCLVLVNMSDRPQPITGTLPALPGPVFDLYSGQHLSVPLVLEPYQPSALAL